MTVSSYYCIIPFGPFVMLVLFFTLVLLVMLAHKAYYAVYEGYPSSVHGTRIQGAGLASMLGFPTINLDLDQNVPCGIYMGNTSYGDVTLIITSTSAECHFIHYNNEIETLDAFDIHDLQKAPSNLGGIIDIYDKGCKSL